MSAFSGGSWKIMKTILDTGHSWSLERLAYGDALEIYIVEGIMSVEPQKIEIAGVNLGEGYSTEVSETSRHFVVVFEDVIACQVSNESYKTGDEYEVRTSGVLCKYERSHYLDFIRSWTLIDSLRANAYAHFGLVLQDHIIDVVAEAEPRIDALS